ncbi:transcriptional corepressor LEUNIG-like protein, partial [Trifolium pratense]
SFENLLYDYLNKKGLPRTAEAFLNETQLAGQIPDEFNQHEHPHGFLYGIWTTFCYKYNSRQYIPGTLISESQAPDIGAIMDSTPQILQEGYTIQLLSSFPRDGPWNTLHSCDFSSDGKIVASGGLGGGKPFLCYLDSNDSVTTSESHSSSIFEVRFQPGSTIFATSSRHTVRLWDAERESLGRSVLDFVGHKGTVRSLDFHPSKGILCSSDSHDVIKVWDLNESIMVKEFKENGSIVRFQPGSGTLLAVANKNVLNILDFENSTVVKRFQGHVENICSICWDVTGNWIASASEDEVRVWSLVMDEPYVWLSDGKKLKSIIFHPRYHNVLVIGSSKGMDLLLLDIDVGLRMKQVYNLPTIGLAACAQNEYIASTTSTTSNDSVVNIWK